MFRSVLKTRPSFAIFRVFAAAGLVLSMAPGCAYDGGGVGSRASERACGIDEDCDPPVECGNGVCEVGEDCSRCSFDCGVCFDPDVINVSGTPDLQPMSQLYAHAHALGVSPLVAGVPNIDSFLASRQATARAYPIGAINLQDFMNKLFQQGSWSTPPTGQSSSPQGTDANGCQITHVDATYNPEELVSFDAGAGLLYPGALIQGKYVNLGLGSLSPIHVPFTQRNPVDLVSSFYSARTAPTPAASDVYTSIGDMIREANINGSLGQSTAYVDIITASTLLEAATKLKVDAKLFGATIGATFSNTTTRTSNTVFVRYVQSLFTVFQDLRGNLPTPAELNSGTMTVSNLENLGAAGEIGYDNLPTYIKAVTYGRMLLFSLTSNESTQDLLASANAVFGKNSVDASQSQKATIKNSEIRVFGYGGPGEPQLAAIKSGSWQDYFSLTNVPLNSLKPLGYEVRRFDDQVAAMSRTTSYDERTCPSTMHQISAMLSDTYKTATVSVQTGGGAWQPVMQTSNGFAEQDISPYLDGSDDQLKISVEAGSTGIFDASHAHLTLTIYVDGVERTQVSWSCNHCHSRDPVWVYRVNKYTGEVTLVQQP